MKPIRLYDDEWYGYIYKCTNCGDKQIWQGFKFCPTCAVEINWSDNP